MVEKGKGNIQFDIKVEGLERLQNAFQRAPEIVGREVQQALNLATIKVQGEARKEAPVKTGNLRRMIVFTVEPFRGIVESKAEYGVYVHEGTKSHIIRPLKKKALYWKGAPHPVKKVMHPGQKPNPFVEKSIDQTTGRLDEFVRRAISETVD